MFTGIIQAVGTVAALQPSNGDLRLRIHTGALPLADVALGDSIASNGCCLTVVELPGDGFWADVSRETIAHTTIAQWQRGWPVNLEKALTPASPLGGHIVSGHVDGIGEVMARSDDARSIRLTLRAPAALARYIAHKGSICMDGVSLTVNAVSGADFELNIIPHTAQMTNIAGYRVGARVNLEVDVIARYLERLLLGAEAAATTNGITAEFLARHGFGPQQ
jgi:riboflavin synthase